MPLIYQYRIYRSDLKRNTGVYYVFGDNDMRQGFGGQAKEMRGEPNAIGVATKWRPDMSPGAFFSDEKMSLQTAMMAADMIKITRALINEKIVVWPSDGIGSGLSQVPTRAPKTWAWMEEIRLTLEKM